MKFNLIYLLILQNVLKIKDFNYKFIFNTLTNKLQCKFESIDSESNSLIFITATINDNDITFEIFSKDNKKLKSYTDKEFLMAYYKDYQNFKQAYNVYKKDPEFFNKKEKESENKLEIKINTLDEVLQNDEIKDNGYPIKIKNIYFTFKQLPEEKLNNIVSCLFSLKNNATFKSSTDLAEYNALITIKMYELNSKILKIELYDPSKETAELPVKLMYEEDFKINFKEMFYTFKTALALYQNHYQKQQDKGI